MRDPIEPDRHEILSGPGDTRLADKPPKNTKKTIAIAASALVAVLAAGGVGYMLAADPVQPGGARPAPAQSTGGNEDLGGDDATMGDVTTDAPEGDPAAGAPDDGSMGDAAPDLGTGDEPTGSDRGTDSATGGKRPATTSPAKPAPTTSAPANPAQPADGDNPADGPAGELSGQCAKSGC
jgi:hypothetical protein